MLKISAVNAGCLYEMREEIGRRRSNCNQMNRNIEEIHNHKTQYCDSLVAEPGAEYGPLLHRPTEPIL